MASTLDKDVPASALANARRRHAVICLQESDSPVALADLAREVAAREDGCTVADVSADRAQRVQSDLYHTHLPKLDDTGVVEFDPSERTVEY